MDRKLRFSLLAAILMVGVLIVPFVAGGRHEARVRACDEHCNNGYWWDRSNNCAACCRSHSGEGGNTYTTGDCEGVWLPGSRYCECTLQIG